MIDIIVLGVLVLIVGIALAYVVKAKKKGVKCIGCPAGGSCGNCDCGCGSQKNY